MAVLGFAISAVGFFLLRNDFSMSTEITDLIPGFLVLGFGTGLLLSQLTNVTMSAASSEQEAEASGFLNTSKNLGYSLGTALIGVLLIMGVFHGLTTTLSTSSLSVGMTKEQVKAGLVDYVENMQTSPPESIPQDQARGDGTGGRRPIHWYGDILRRAGSPDAPGHGYKLLHAEDAGQSGTRIKVEPETEPESG